MNKEKPVGEIKLVTRSMVILFLLLFVVLASSLGIKMGFTIIPSDAAVQFYNSIEALKPGDIVIFSIDHTRSSWPELGGAQVAAVQHLKSKGAQIIFLGTTFVDCTNLYETELRPYMEDKKIPYIYGTDYVYMGFYPGREAGAAELAKNMRLKIADVYGTSIEKLPLMMRVKTASDIALVITSDDGSATIKCWILQWVTQYKTKVLSVAMAGGRVTLEPYRISGQLAGLSAGVMGAAEYEVKLGKLGMGYSMLVAITLGSLYIIAVVIAGNIVYLVTKRTGQISKVGANKAVTNGSADNKR